MGTRNLTAVFLDGEYKIAQYGQWDGYPAGQGKTCMDFLRQKMNLDVFKKALRNSHFLSSDEVDRLVKESNGKLLKLHPELHRDTAAEILEIVQDHPEGMGLESSLDFAADSLFCEWAWVIDLDKGTFEAFRGFNQKPLTEEDRFYFLRDKENKDSGYHGVMKIAEWSLDNLYKQPEFFGEYKEARLSLEDFFSD